MSHTLKRPDFDLIAGWMKAGDSVLDLGCGEGELLQLLATRGLRGWGVDCIFTDCPDALGRAAA